MIHVQKTNKDAVDAVAAKTRPQHETDGNISTYLSLSLLTHVSVYWVFECVSGLC